MEITCNRCNGKGRIVCEMAYHGERSDFWEECCPDCSGSGKAECRCRGDHPMMKLSETHLDYLKMYGPDAHAINLPYSIAKTLEIKGLIESRSPQTWAITEKGKRAVREATR